MAAKSKRYFGLSWLVCLILAILPTNVICGVVTRFLRGNILGGILNIILCPLFYIIDLITMIFAKDITVLA